MEPAAHPYDEVLSAAAEGALVLTVNKRLSRHLRGAFDAAMLHRGLAAWVSPDILPLDAWMHRAAGQAGLDGSLLDRQQALTLWEEVIGADHRGSEDQLLQIPPTAELALDAHRLLVEYGASFSAEEGGDDHRAFLRWREGWSRRCREGGWLDPAELSRLLCLALEESRLPLRPQAFLVGFDELGPPALRLAAALTKAGCPVREVPPARGRSGKVCQVPCEDPAAEVRRCARWLRSLLELGERRLGVVVFGLERYRPLVERIFREELAPATLLSGAGGEAPFSCSLGAPLAEEGMVAAALEILALDHRIPLTRASLLLRSPFWAGHGEEGEGRAFLDRELRRLGVAEVTLRQLCARARQGFAGGLGRAPRLAQSLDRLLDTLAGGGTRPPGAWAGHFASCLKAAGWPGDRSLASREFQAFHGFKDLLGRLAALDAVTGPVTRGSALSTLRRLARQGVFQPDSPDGPVLVLGPLEAAGLAFDHLWLLGLHEEALPAPPRPNPFLPLPLQRRLEMPHASAERELDFGRLVAGRLLASAPRVWASFPRQAEGSEHRPSPFLRDFPQGAPPEGPTQEPAALLWQARPALENLLDPTGPPLPPGEEASGGTAILRDQALCPFRAFARHRLRAAGLESPGVGLDAGARGVLIHAVLEIFWRRTGDSGALASLTPAALRLAVEGAVTGALDRYETERRLTLEPELRKLEGERLALLALEWLDLERGRPPFAVSELETRHQEVVGGLTIRARVDRIDTLADGSRVILDYKTGQANPRDWFGERLREPQLPIYAVGEGGGGLSAVAFARVRRGECFFTGVGRSDDLLPRVPAAASHRALSEAGIAGWPELLDSWRSSLDRLGSAYRAGEAPVDPLDPKQACGTCDLHPLCRITEGDGAFLEQEGEG